MPATTITFGVQPGATPVPTPGSGASGGGQGLGIDLGPLIGALSPERLFSDLLLRLTKQLTDALGEIWDRMWHSPVNVFTYTSPSITYEFGPVAQLLAGMQTLVMAITAAGVVLAAVMLAGREVFGWGDNLGEHLGRLGLAAILANGSFFLTRTAIDWNNLLCEAIGFARLSAGFRGYGVDSLSGGILILALLWFGLQLGLRMVRRIGMLWILIVTAPLALAMWAVPQAQWVATTWTRQFVGWTFGQVLVTIALKLGTTAGPFCPGGSTELGLIFSIVMASLAIDLVDLLVHGSVPRFGTARAAMQLVRSATAARAAFVAAYSRTGAGNQRRLPGF